VRLVYIQAMVALVGVLALVAAPPATGMMLLVPLSSQAAAALPSAVVRGNTRLVAQGPFPGSLVVYGSRQEIALPLLVHGVLTFASLRQGCSKSPT
jgi:hypothetical protein